MKLSGTTLEGTFEVVLIFLMKYMLKESVKNFSHINEYDYLDVYNISGLVR